MTVSKGRINRLIHAHKEGYQINKVIWKGSKLEINERRFVTDASIYATVTHRNKKRRNGDPIIFHERAMFIIALLYCRITDWQFLAACFLHDLLEDYPDEWPYEIIVNEFNKKTADLVFAVTKPPRMHYQSENDYNIAIFTRVRRGGTKAIKLKIIDRYHNMITLWGPRGKQIMKILQTIKFVLPMAKEMDFLYEELKEATREQMERLGMDMSLLESH